MEKSHRVVIGIVASMGLGLCVANAHAHPGAMGGGMGPGMMGSAGAEHQGQTGPGHQSGKGPGHKGAMGAGHQGGTNTGPMAGNCPMAAQHTAQPTQSRSH